MAADDRLSHLLAEIASSAGGDPTLMVQQLCDRVAVLLDVTGAAVSLMGTDGLAGVVYASGEASMQLADLEFVMHEGPGLDAFNGRDVVLLPQLEGTGRWLGYESAAASAGARAVFAFPLQLGAIRLGALVVHRAAPGRLSRDHVITAFAIAEAMTHLLLVAANRSDGDQMGADWTDLDGDWTVVHQATGMVSVQLGVPVAEALVLLRARAFSASETIRDVAHAVVARRLRLGSDGDERTA